MRIVGVIDVREGRAVHARGGQRNAYAPVDEVAGETVNGDVVALASAYVTALGVRELYLADLDAISGGVDAMNRDVVTRVAALGVPLWVDAGVSTVAAAESVLGAGAARVIVGLETLTSIDELTSICATVGGEHVAFSLDLRGGRPIVLPNAAHSTWSATDIAGRAAESGARHVIVLDLARVGTSIGVDLELMNAIRQAAPRVALFAGGGVRGNADLDALAAAGCDGALVATALINGAIRPRAL